MLSNYLFLIKGCLSLIEYQASNPQMIDNILTGLYTYKYS